jgi:hypothetical protein
MLRIEVRETFERALDDSWRRLRDKARAQWENQLMGSDPSDACASVRIIDPTDKQSSPMPCGGFLAKPPQPETGKVRPRLA